MNENINKENKKNSGFGEALQYYNTPVTPTGDQPATAVRSRTLKIFTNRSEIAEKCEIHDTI